VTTSLNVVTVSAFVSYIIFIYFVYVFMLQTVESFDIPLFHNNATGHRRYAGICADGVSG